VPPFPAQDRKSLLQRAEEWTKQFDAKGGRGKVWGNGEEDNLVVAMKSKGSRCLMLASMLQVKVGSSKQAPMGHQGPQHGGGVGLRREVQ
jgi:hypothetical protein